MTENQEISGDFFEQPRYYAQIPNCADDELTIYEYRLYGHYKRLIGADGLCWESNKTTAEKCGMSISTMRSARKGLVDKGYIKMVHKTKEDGSQDTVKVSLPNIWKRNILIYLPSEHAAWLLEGGMLPENRPVLQNRGLTPKNRGMLPRTHKEKQPKKKRESKTQNTPQPPQEGGGDVVPPFDLSAKESILKSAGIDAKSWKHAALWTCAELTHLVNQPIPRGWESKPAYIVTQLKDTSARAAIQADLLRIHALNEEIERLVAREYTPQDPPPTPSLNPLLVWDKVASHMKYSSMKPGDYDLYLANAAIDVIGDTIRVGVTAHQAGELNKRFLSKIERHLFRESGGKLQVEIVNLEAEVLA